LVVCQRPSDGRFLTVQEFGRQGYWLPGGAVDPGEDIRTAAVRETLEEAGVRVKLTGVLRVELQPLGDCARLRVVFFGIPDPEGPPAIEKTLPDYESTGAAWVTVEDVLTPGLLNLRGPEPAQWFPYITKNGPIYPLEVLTPHEGSNPTIPRWEYRHPCLAEFPI
jgi:8-oxo-dGTP pyrophosphatase MutT (NUDIX family)